MHARFSVRQAHPLATAAFLMCLGQSTSSQVSRSPAVAVPAPPSHLIQSIHVSPQVAFAGTDLRVIVRVTPDALNRRLQLAVDAPTYYASTERQLDGLRAARAHSFLWHELPAGEYQITATVEGDDGVRTKIIRPFRVLGDASELTVEERPRGRRPGGRRGGS